MWLVMLASQFIVYISHWQIDISKETRAYISELKRVAFAEYFDDIQFTSYLKGLVGISEEEEEDNEQKLGAERLGSSNLFQNYGITFFIFVGLLLLVVILVLALYLLCVKNQKCCSAKN